MWPLPETHLWKEALIQAGPDVKDDMTGGRAGGGGGTGSVRTLSQGAAAARLNECTALRQSDCVM